jgi:ketosteroid isomerase-like protein
MAGREAGVAAVHPAVDRHPVLPDADVGGLTATTCRWMRSNSGRRSVGSPPRRGVVMSNVNFVRDLYTEFGSGDVPAVLGGMSADIEWREAENNPYQMSGSAWVGPDAILQNLFMRLATEWDTFTVLPKDLHDAGDTVVAEGRYTGTYKETGRSLDAQFCHVFKIRDGKVSSFQQFTDTAQLQHVMGARG